MALKLHLTKKQKEKIFALPVEQAVLVPSTTKADKPVSLATMKRRIKRVREFLSKKYGGYTSVKGIGGYVSKKKRLIKEPVVKVTAFATAKAYKKEEQNTLQQVSKWSKKWGQESVGYELEGDLYYIEKNLPKKVRRKLRR